MIDSSLDLDTYVSVARTEQGETFALLPTTYRRLAAAALAIPDQPPMFLRKLRYKGCALEIFSTRHVLTISVLPGDIIANISLSAAALDSTLEPVILFTGDDTEDAWRCLTGCLLANAL